MIIWVHDALFSKERHDPDLLTLLRNAAVRRHTLLISTHLNAPQPRQITPCFEQWLESFSNPLQSEIRLLHERLKDIPPNATARGTTRLLVATENLPDEVEGCQVSLAEAVRAAAQPLYLLVEDQINDAAFLRQVMPPSWRKKMQKWEKSGQLRYENRGGIHSMKRLVDFHSQDSKARLAYGLPAKLWWLTHFIIFDHDGDAAECPSEDSKSLGKSCDEGCRLSHYHRLERRTQENYLPKKAMEIIVEEGLSNQSDREEMLRLIEQHHEQDIQIRYFAKMPSIGKKYKKIFKNKFNRDTAWPSEWFKEDGVWPEMTTLAEKIAAAM
ncbi:MAG: hypothetical protein D3909_09035 [Candidatus Electrothrix sp. ATG1]|nr:hypothetical protein [Candidatus Electrothrix sp. ATG1]